MTIPFNRVNGKIYNAIDNQEIDPALLSTFPVEYALDHMSGTISLPSFVGGVESEEIKFLGTTVPKTDKTALLPKIEGLRKNSPSLTSYLETSPEDDIIWEAEEIENLGVVDETFEVPVTLDISFRVEMGKVTQICDISPADFDKIIKTMAETGIQFYTPVESTLRSLGFIPRPNSNGSVHRWYHPMLGDDRADNHLLFDLETDAIEHLGIKIFRLGARLGSTALKLRIKATLEQH